MSTEAIQTGPKTRQPLKPLDTNNANTLPTRMNQNKGEDPAAPTDASATGKQNYRDQKRAERQRLYKNKKKETRKLIAYLYQTT
jgi:hypothetical protein